MKTGIYVRVSTEEQVSEGYSIQTQKDKLSAYCISQGWKNYTFYVDEGLSAKDTNRPKLQEMLTDIQNERVSIVLVYKLDRLTRSVKDLYELLETFERYDCKFKSATEVFDTTNAMGRLFLTLVAALSEWERQTISERVRVVMEQKVSEGHWAGGTLAYGYEYVDGQIVINETEAEAVKLIYNKIKTTGAYKVARELTELGYPTRHGDIWHMETVRRISKNKWYAGYQSFGDATYKSNHPAIITEQDYDETQKVLESRKGAGSKGKTGNYIFSSVLLCGVCGSKMSGHKGLGGVKVYRCYRKKTRGNCSSSMIMEKTLEKWLLDNMDNLYKELTEPMTFDVPKDNDKYFDELEKELKQVRKMMDKHKKMFEADIIDIDELKRKIKQLRDREKELNDLLSKKEEQSEKQAMIQETVSIFDDVYPHATDEEKKYLISNLFETIVVRSEGEHHARKTKKLIVMYVE